MSKKKDNTKKTPRQDFKVLVYPVKHTFNDAELIDLGRGMWREQGEINNLETNLSSIKADFKSKIEAAEGRRNEFGRKQAEGFEIRQMNCICDYNSGYNPSTKKAGPKKGRKVYWELDTQKSTPTSPRRGAFVVEEAMTESDLQMEMAAMASEAAKANVEPKPGDNLNPVGEAMDRAKPSRRQLAAPAIEAEIVPEGTGPTDPDNGAVGDEEPPHVKQGTGEE